MAGHFITDKIHISGLYLHLCGLVCFLLLCGKQVEHPCREGCDWAIN